MNNSFVTYIADDLLREYDVKARAMFGGYGLSTKGTTFGMIVDDVLYFKVDDSNKADYEKYSMKPFTYHHSKSGKDIAMSYYEVPPQVVEDEKLIGEYLQTSLGIARSKKK